MAGSFDVCRSPPESRHRLLYKTSTPPWKETYRKRCQERLAENRHSFLEKFRHKDIAFNDEEAREAIHNLVLSEWKSFEKDMKESTLQNPDSAPSLPAENIDQVLSIFDEITLELLQEEQQIISEYEASLQVEENFLHSSIDRLNAYDVICPVCKRSPLFINKGIIFCNCGVRIDTEQDAITLAMVKANLDEAVRQHSASCECCPSFGVVSHIGISNLLMTGGACDFMFVII